MKIDVSNPDFYFAFFYVLSFAVTFVLFIFFGKRLKIPLRYFFLLTTVSLCTIVGSRLATIPVTEWGQLIITGRFEGYQWITGLNLCCLLMVRMNAVFCRKFLILV
jgi:hypothetical protein